MSVGQTVQTESIGHLNDGALQVAEREAIAKDLGLEKGKPREEVFDALAKDPELQKMAAEHVARLIAVSKSDDAVAMNDAKMSVDTIGLNTQREATNKCKLLDEPIRRMAMSGVEGGQVAKDLIDLKMNVEKLDPNNIDFSPGWFSRFTGIFSDRLKRYFTQYESSQTIIAAILNSLAKGREELLRDNVTLAEEQGSMRNISRRLEKVIAMVRLMEKQIVDECAKIEDGESRKQYLEEEILFPMRQRIIELQTQLTVNLQGVLAIEMIIRTNRELIRGVRGTENTTISALRVACIVSVALNHQEILLDKIEGIRETTGNMIAGTAKRLRTKGVDIQKKASGAPLEVKKLKEAFNDINAAMKDLANFRREALPQMATLIGELDTVSAQAEEAVQKMERGNRAAPNIIDLPENMAA
ncbi:MAG: toxic anion resistance protein [Patescibacteria group bacterium]